MLSAFDFGLSSTDPDRIFISPQTIQDAIGKLRRGKLDGGRLTIEHDRVKSGRFLLLLQTLKHCSSGTIAVVSFALASAYRSILL